MPAILRRSRRICQQSGKPALAGGQVLGDLDDHPGQPKGSGVAAASRICSACGLLGPLTLRHRGSAARWRRRDPMTGRRRWCRIPAFDPLNVRGKTMLQLNQTLTWGEGWGWKAFLGDAGAIADVRMAFTRCSEVAHSDKSGISRVVTGDAPDSLLRRIRWTTNASTRTDPNVGLFRGWVTFLGDTSATAGVRIVLTRNSEAAHSDKSGFLVSLLGTHWIVFLGDTSCRK